MAQKEQKQEQGAAEDKATADGPKSGSRKLLILGLLAGLVVGGGGAAAYFLFLAPSPAKEAPAEPQTPAAPEIVTGFVPLERMSAPLVQNGQVLGYVLLDLSLEVEEGEGSALVTQRLPALRAAFLRDMTQTPIGKPDAPMVIDYDSLMIRLKEAANRELGQAAVIRVLVTQSTRL